MYQEMEKKIQEEQKSEESDVQAEQITKMELSKSSDEAVETDVQPKQRNIRVLLMNQTKSSPVHEQVILQSAGDFESQVLLIRNTSRMYR